MGTGYFPGVKSGRSVTLTPHPLLVPWSRKNRAIPLLPLWSVRSVQNPSFCTRVHFTPFFFSKETGLSKWSAYVYQSVWFHITEDDSSLSVLLTSRISSIIFFPEILISLNVLSCCKVHLWFKFDSQVYISGQSEVKRRRILLCSQVCSKLAIVSLNPTCLFDIGKFAYTCTDTQNHLCKHTHSSKQNDHIL